MGTSNLLGERGEACAFSRLTDFCRDGSDPAYFQPCFLGGKWKTFDFMVELIGAEKETPFFFVQVKTTQGEFTKTRNHPHPRLPVRLSKEEVLRMAAFPAPTYVIGVYARKVPERAFIISVHGSMSSSISSITTAYELNRETLRKLWEEVRDFWGRRTMSRETSFFLN